MRHLLIPAVPCILFAFVFHARCADFVLLPEAEGTDEAPTAVRFVFAGEPCLLQWVVRGEALANLRKPVCEVYRVSASTAVPAGELKISFDSSMAEEAAAAVLSTRFEAPSSDRPARFLLKIWNEVGEERGLLAMIFMQALPATTLDFLNGRIVHAIAFTEGGS